MAGDRVLTVRLVGNSKGAVSAIRDTEKASGGLEGKLKSVSDRFTSVGKSMVSAGGTLTRNVTLPIVGLGVASFKMAKDFEGSFNNIRQLVGTSESQIQRWQTQVLNMAKKLPQAPKELADALYFVSSSGFKGAEAMRVLRASAKAAAAGLGDTEGIADAVTSALNAYGKENLSASQATDVMVKAVAEGKAEADEMTAVWGRLLPITSEMGVSFDQVGASLASLSLSGMNAREAATSVQSILSGLLKPSKAGSDALANVGLSFDDLRNSVANKGLFPTLMRVRKEFDGNQEALSKVIPNVRALRGFLAITGNQADKSAKIFKNMKNSTGEADEAFGKASKTIGFKWNSMVSTLQVTMIQFGNMLMPFAMKATEALSKFAGWIDKLSPAQKKWAGVIALVAAAAGPLLMVLGGLAMAIGALLSPVGLVIAAVVAVGAVLAGAYAKSEAFREGVASIGKALKPLLGELGGFVKTLIPIFKEFGAALAERVGPILRDLGDIIAAKVIPAIQTIMTVAGPVIRFLLRMFAGALVGAIEGFLQAVKGIIQVISGVFGLIKAIITGDWSAAWEAVKQILTGVWNTIIGLIKFWWNAGIMSIFRQGFKMVWNVFKKGWAKITGSAKGFIGKVKNILKNIIKVITWPHRKAFKIAKDFVSTGWKYITGRFSGGVGGIRKVLSRLKEVVTYPFKRAFDAGKSAVKSGWNKVKDFFGDGIGSIRRILGRLKSAVTSPLSNSGRWLLNAGKKIIGGLIDGIWSMVDNLKGTLGKVTKYIPDWKGPADKDARLLRPAGRLVLGGFMDGIGDKVRPLRRMLQGVTTDLASDALGSPLATHGASGGANPRGSHLRGSGGGVTVIVQVEGNLIGERDFADRVTPVIRKNLSDIGKRNNGKIFLS